MISFHKNLQFHLSQKNKVAITLGRVVITHSTYIKGLIPVLKKLALHERIKTVTPAIISKVRGRSSKLTIRVSVITIGGYKAIARKGQSAQEIFITTDMNIDELKYLLNRYCSEQITMKLFFKLYSLSLFLLVSTLESYSISNIQIYKICRTSKREKACIKRLKLKREFIYKGKPIEIPVYPYKSK